MFQKTDIALIKYWPALICGGGLTLAFSDAGGSFFAFAALVPLFVCAGRLSLKNAFFWGLWAGLVYFLTLIYWILPTVNRYGGLHPVLAAGVLVLLCIYLALYVGVFAVIVKKLYSDAAHPETWYLPLAAAAAWTGLEYIRTYAFTGFGWGALGYSQSENLTIIQIADISGVYGVSFLIVMVNGVLAQVWTAAVQRRRPPVVALGYAVFLVAAVFYYGQKSVETVGQEMTNARKLSVSVVQGNIRQDVKWDQAFASRTVEKYIRLSEQALENTPQLIIWPETALPFYYGLDRPLSDTVDRFIRSAATYFLIGSPAAIQTGDQVRYYNRAYLLGPFAMVRATYDKHHLVPFGEYIPLENYLGFLGKITQQAGSFSMGEGLFSPLVFGPDQAGVMICFEILFPGIASGFVQNGATLLTTITNDAWFGDSSAPHQHFAIAVFRAVENRRSLARAANTGISGIIYPDGTVVSQTRLFADAVVTEDVPLLTCSSFYTVHGDLFAVSSLVAICLVFVLKGATGLFRKTVEEKTS